MSSSKQIVNALLKEDLIEAKKLINHSLLEKLGNALEDKLVEFAPTIFEGSKKTGPNNKGHLVTNQSSAGGSKAKTKKPNKMKTESVIDNDDLEELVEDFENEIMTIISDIQEELGENLTEEEIMEISEEYLDVLLGESKSKKHKPDADGDGVPDWADKHPGEDDEEEEKESPSKEKKEHRRK